MSGWRPESDPLPWPGGKEPEYVPETKRWHALTRGEFITHYLNSDEYEEAFQLRDWDAVERIQDASAAAWEEGPVAT